jgi:hypothetical protein
MASISPPEHDPTQDELPTPHAELVIQLGPRRQESHQETKPPRDSSHLVATLAILGCAALIVILVAARHRTRS